MERRNLITMLAAALCVRPALAAPVSPVVVELFTSQGCSSCPPADSLLTELARDRADVLALAFHVTYWNGLGWPDPFSLEAATSRQRRYAKLLSTEVYTPQIVVNGGVDVVGSDRARVLAAIASTAAQPAGPAFSITVNNDEATIMVGEGEGSGEVLLLGYDPMHSTRVVRGENAGHALVESNIVRSLVTAGAWRGAVLHIAVPLPAGERFCALLQGTGGRIIAAVRAE